MDRPFNPWLHEFYSRFSPDIASADRLRVVFLIGSADISGGTYVIFEHALRVRAAGGEVVVVPMFDMSTVARDWHPALADLEFATMDDIAGRDFDVAVATWWPTVFELPKVRFRHAVYFVQSAESRFYALGPDRDSSMLAELTYTLGLPVITIATWLQVFLAFEHGSFSFLCRNGIDKQRYRPDGPTLAPVRTEGLRVLVEGSDASMKGVARAVEAATEAGVDEVWLLTPSDVTRHPGVDRVISRIPAAETPSVYRACDVLVKLSQVEGMYGPPLEMFHCGGTVVTNDVSGHDEYVRDGYNGLVVPTDDVGAAVAAIGRLKSDPQLLRTLRENALRTAQGWRDWDQAGEEFVRILTAVAKQRTPDRVSLLSRVAGLRSLHRELVQGG
ncbi:MAG TPA: glycosyltransferase family 4 protein [Actinomycetota bacterium]|nr:glycosyltransferase family 4 protein [Actinomycetota bacterium]